MPTLPQQFISTAERFSNRLALRYKHGGVYVGITFAELRHRVEHCAAGLQSLGVQVGDRVAIFSNNSPEWVVADLATQWLGAISVPVHTTFSTTLIDHILCDSGASVLILGGQAQLEKLRTSAVPLPQLQSVVSFGLNPSPGEIPFAEKRHVTFGELIRNGESGSSPSIFANSSAPASIIYTSGTTGLPKGVVLTHQNLHSNAEGAVTVVPVTELDTLLSFLPLSHVLERTAGYYAPLLCRGACIAFAESPKTLQDNLREVHPTILVAVPRVFEKLHDGIWAKVNAGSAFKRKLFIAALKSQPGTLRHRILDHVVFAKVRHRLGGRLRLVISGGASLNPKLMKFFQRLGLHIVEGYGLTETSPIITVNPPDRVRVGSVGLPIPGVEVKIGTDKEILARGSGIMAGYWQNQAATSELVDADGWLHTGDQGFIDADGFLSIIGRTKELIVTAGGKNVWPEPIEFKLNDDRWIAQSIVAGEGKKYIVALVVPFWPAVLEFAKEKGLSQDPRVLRSHLDVVSEFARRVERVNHELADWEKIKRFALLLEEFTQERDELTPTLKLRRRSILGHASKEYDALYFEQ